ncbi:MAG: extracellular solute-binding protein [Candidatus Hydrogenedentes bacterium]|nr:extracellular solute-binding protein [Candidatus Hydrogenedentota bacterium]
MAILLTWATISSAEVRLEELSDTITLYFWGFENDTLAPEVIQDFETLHDGRDGKPRIKVIMGQSASFDKTGDPQRLLCSITGGDPPDVVTFDRFAVGEWAARGAFQSLQPFLERDLRERRDDPLTLRQDQFYPPCWAEASYHGELFAVPSDTDNRAMYYNIDLLEKHAPELIAAGCTDLNDPTKVGPPRTWDQLRAATRILSEYDEKERLVRIGFLPHSPSFGNSWLYIYGWLNGGEFMSEDGLTCTLNSPQIAEALAYMTELYDIMGGTEAVLAFQASTLGGDLDPFMSGKIVMKIDGDGYIGSIANFRRDMRFGVCLAPAPEGKNPLGWCGGWSWVIPKGAKYPEEAWEFIKHMASKRAYQIRADANKQILNAAGNVFIPWISARVDITQWAMDYYLFRDPTIGENFKISKRIFVDAMPFSRYRPVSPVGQLLWMEQRDGMEDGIYLRYDKQDRLRNAQIALDKHAAIVQKELDRIFKPRHYPTLRWSPIVITYTVLIGLAFVVLYFYFDRKVNARGYFRHEFYAGYLFAAPWFVGFTILGGGPIVFSVFMSFCEYDVLSEPKFVGFKNYLDMFVTDDLFLKSLGNTVFMTLGIPLGMAVGLGIAMLLNYEIKGMAVYRTFFYLPSIMPAVAASILWMWIFNPKDGILNNLLSLVWISGPAWLQEAPWSKPALILMGLWGAGSGMIVWLAGLKGIPMHLYEAAMLDGAGRFRQFWNVTVPMLTPYIFFNLVMGLIGTFQIFSQAYIMTQGGPVNSTLFYAYHLFNNAFRYLKMGYASAMAWVLFAIVLVLTIVQIRLSRRWVHYESEL